MANEFQLWLTRQGFERKDSLSPWIYKGEIVSGLTLYNKLEEWKNLNTKK